MSPTATKDRRVSVGKTGGAICWVGTVSAVGGSSVSEGGAVSVLNVLGNGALLPVYSEATGIALSEVGICVPNVTYKEFEMALLNLATISDVEFEQKALAAHRLVKDNYTIEQYEKRMYLHLKDIIEKTDK